MLLVCSHLACSLLFHRLALFFLSRPDSQLLFTAGNDGGVFLWRVNVQMARRDGPLRENVAPVVPIAVLNEGKCAEELDSKCPLLPRQSSSSGAAAAASDSAAAAGLAGLQSNIAAVCSLLTVPLLISSHLTCLPFFIVCIYPGGSSEASRGSTVSH